jgi:hypothetical protein
MGHKLRYIHLFALPGHPMTQLTQFAHLNASFNSGYTTDEKIERIDVFSTLF